MKKIFIVLTVFILQGCATSMKTINFTTDDGSQYTFHQTGCNVTDGEIHSTRTISFASKTLLAVDDSGRSIGEWSVWCGATIAKGNTTCKVKDKKLPLPSDTGGLWCPTLSKFTLM